MVANILAPIYVSVAWGLAFVLIKFAEETVAPLTVQAGRATIGFLALLVKGQGVKSTNDNTIRVN